MRTIKEYNEEKKIYNKYFNVLYDIMLPHSRNERQVGILELIRLTERMTR